MSKTRKRFKNLSEKTQKHYKDRNKYGTGKNYYELPDNMEEFKPKEGVNKIDIIPYIVKTDQDPQQEKGEGAYVLYVWVHKNIGINKNQFVCLSKNFDKPCPICEEVEELKNSGDSELEELGEIYKAKQRVLYNVKHKGEIKIFEESHFSFQKTLLEESLDDSTGDVITFADPDDGKTIKFTDSGVWNDRFKRFRFLDREEEITDEELDEAVSLEELLTVYTYDELKNYFHSANIKDDDEEIDDEEIDDEEIDDEEIDDEDDNEIEEDDEEEDLPKKRKNKSKKKNHKEIDDEDDDEEEKPKRKREKLTSKKKPKCPYGYSFGADHDSEDECDECDEDLWGWCAAEKRKK